MIRKKIIKNYGLNFNSISGNKNKKNDKMKGKEKNSIKKIIVKVLIIILTQIFSI